MKVENAVVSLHAKHLFRGVSKISKQERLIAATKKQRALEQQAAVERAALQSALEGESTQAKLKAAAAEDEKKAFIEKSKVPLPPFSALSRAPPPSSAVPRPLPRSYRTHHRRP